MNTLYIVVIGILTIYLAYNFYAKRIDRDVIQADPKKATPAKLYNDGVDFMPTSRNVLYGYHFKSVAAAGPIVGVITAALLWGWLPAVLWLALGVTFIGWVSDYSAIMLSVRNDGNSLSAIAHKLIAPRTRQILFVFIFFYLLLVAGAFVGIMAAVLNGSPATGLAILGLMILGLAAGHMLYKMKMDLILVTAITVGLTVLVVLAGPLDQVKNAMADFNKTINTSVTGPYGPLTDWQGKPIANTTGPKELLKFYDPTPNAITGAAGGSGVAIGSTAFVTPSLLFWVLFVFLFSYLGAILPIWRYTQPVNYIGFWVTALTIVLSWLGAALAGIGSLFNIGALSPQVSAFTLDAFKGFDPGQGGMIQPLWPMLFVTIACGAISGWHALIGSVGTSRQLEFETDALPVGGGGMLSENALALVALMAVSVAGIGGGGGRFAQGIGKFLSVFGLDAAFGQAVGFAAFVIIVLTVVQLLFRVMRVTLAEWLGDTAPALRNVHVATIISMILTLFLVVSGTWVYLWQLFGASNQLLAALSLLIVTIWLISTKRNAAFAGIPMLFMYVTTMASIVVTGYNMWSTVLFPKGQLQTDGFALMGGVIMVGVAALLFICAAIIAWDGWKAYQNLKSGEAAKPAPAAGTAGR